MLDKTTLGAEVRRRVSENLKLGFPLPPALRYFASLAIEGAIKLPALTKKASADDRNALLIGLTDKIHERWQIPKTTADASFVAGEPPPLIASVIVAAALHGLGVFGPSANYANEIAGKPGRQNRALDPGSPDLCSSRELLDFLGVAEILDSIAYGEATKAFSDEIEEAKKFLLRKTPHKQNT